MVDFSGKKRARELDLGRATSLAQDGLLGREVETGNPGEETQKWWQKIKPTASGAEVPVVESSEGGQSFGWQQRNRPFVSTKYQPTEGEDSGMGSKG